MSTTTIVPNGVVTSVNVTPTGGTADAVLADASDATYDAIGAGLGGQLRLAFGTFSLPAGAVITSLTYQVRAKGGAITPNSSLTLTAYVPSVSAETGVASVTGTITDFSVPHGNVFPSVQASIDGIEMMLSAFDAVAYKLSLVFVYALIPSVAVSAPTGTITTTSTPTVAWTHTPGSDALGGQTKYQIRVFSAAQYGAGGFDPATSAATLDTGQVASSTGSAAVGPLANSTTYRAYVRTAQTTLGVDQWSAYAYPGSNFSISLTTSDVGSVVATPINATGRNQIVVTRTGATAWTSLEVQSSYDGGATWNYVRGYTRFATTATPVTLFDYEAPNGTACTYRSRATYQSSGQDVTGAWVSSSACTWSSLNVWLKDIMTPANNTIVDPTALPESTYERSVGVFRPIGATYPVVISDTRQAGVSAIKVLTDSAAKEAALRKACEATVLLVQVPAVSGYGWGNRYCAPGALKETRVAYHPDIIERVWELQLTEVARPADTGIF